MSRVIPDQEIIDAAKSYVSGAYRSGFFHCLSYAHWLKFKLLSVKSATISSRDDEKRLYSVSFICSAIAERVLSNKQTRLIQYTTSFRVWLESKQEQEELIIADLKGMIVSYGGGKMTEAPSESQLIELAKSHVQDVYFKVGKTVFNWLEESETGNKVITSTSAPPSNCDYFQWSRCLHLKIIHCELHPNQEDTFEIEVIAKTTVVCGDESDYRKPISQPAGYDIRTVYVTIVPGDELKVTECWEIPPF